MALDINQNPGDQSAQVNQTSQEAVSSTKNNTLYGDNAHQGAETFNGAAIFNAAVSFNGLVNFLSQVATGIWQKLASPFLRLTGTEASAKDWRVAEDGGLIKIQENTGTEGTPTWTTRFSVDSTGIVAGVPTLARGRTTKTNGDFSTGSTSFVDVTGLAATVTTGARRCLVSLIASALNNVAMFFNLTIDGTSVGQTFGLIEVAPGTGMGNASFTFLTDALTAGSHTFQIQMLVNSGTGKIKASTDTPAILSVVELSG